MASFNDVLATRWCGGLASGNITSLVTIAREPVGLTDHSTQSLQAFFAKDPAAGKRAVQKGALEAIVFFALRPHYTDELVVQVSASVTSSLHEPLNNRDQALAFSLALINLPLS